MRMERPEAEILHRKRGKKREKKAKMIKKRQSQSQRQRQRQRTERERNPDRERVNRLLKEKGTTHLWIHLMPLDRNTPTESSMIRGCDDGGVMMAQWWWRYCSRPSGYMAREQIISYYCVTAHTLLGPELTSYRLLTTWVRNVRARAGLH